MQGWICLNRKLLDSSFWKKRPFSQGQAWVDLLLTVNHEDKEITVDGKKMVVEAGSILTSMSKLALRWGWDRKTVSKFLMDNELDNRIHTKRTTHWTMISLVNWALYQCDGQRIGQQVGQPIGQQTPTNNNITINNKQSNREKYIKEKHKYGEFKNVLLTDEELEKLKEKRPDNWEECIEILSEGLARKGYKYKSHYLAILKWTEKEARKGESKNDREQREDIRKADEEYKFS